MINTESLRNKILDLAIQGKLTEQLPEDGNAEDLYAQIQEEKQRLIAEGKIKKEKALPPIADEEKPFEIPRNWKWVWFGDIMRNRDSERVPVSVADRKKLKKTYDYYGASGVIDKVEDYLFNGKLLLIAEDGANLVSRSTTIAFMAKGKFWVNNHAHVLDYYCVDYLDYVMFYVNSISLVPFVTGSAQPKLNQDNMNKIPVPLPSLEEQKRIVSAVEDAFAVIDKIEKAQESYYADQEVLKNKIIDAGIQGKLTQQLPEDGNAEDLYAQIQEEKQRLIAEGKIKKEKPLPEIEPEEIPFEIPKNWKWVRLGTIGAPVLNAFADGPFGSNLKTEHYTQEKQVRIIQLSNVGEYGWKNENEKYTTFEHLESIKRSEVKAGDIVIAKMMPAGRAIIVPDVSKVYVLSSDCVKVVPNKSISTKYICYAINSNVFNSQVIGNIKGIGRERTSLSSLKGYILPLPPMAEQKRIVQMIESALEAIES